MGAPKLKEEVAEKYVLGTHHTKIIVNGTEYNLCTISLKEADELVAAGNFPYLKEIKRKPKKQKS